MDKITRGASAITWTCENRACEEIFLRLPWEVKKGAKRFCSNSCYIKEHKAMGRWDKNPRVPVDPNSPKKCTKCGEEKDRSEFGKNARNKDGLMTHCKICHTTRTLKYYYDRGGYSADRRFVRHGISREVFEMTLASQDGGCAICGKKDERMVVDHDHQHCNTNYGCAECFRGVLCLSCNAAMGIFKDDVELLQKAIDYLSTSKKIFGLVA